MTGGYIKLYRQLLDNPVVCKDAYHYAIWGYLLLSATHDNYDVVFGKKRITLKPGQLITSRKSISEQFHINESKCERVLTLFKNEQMIEQQSSSKNRLITIQKWTDYQSLEQQNEQQVNNNRTTSEQQVNTNKNVKKNKNVKNKEDSSSFTPPTLDEVIAYAKEKNQNEDLARRFYDYFTTGDWIDSKGKKVSNWKQKFITWISYNGGTQKKRVESITAYPNHSDTTELTEDEAEDLAKQFARLGEN